MSATLRLKQAEAALRHHLAPDLAMHGLSFEQWQVLAALLAEPGQRMTDLARTAALAAASLTRHVDYLVESAMVVRCYDPADRRRIAVALSSRGEQIARRLQRVETTATDRIDALASRAGAASASTPA